MAAHRVYASIVRAVESGLLRETFTSDDFRIACPGFGEGTYKAFLYKHRIGNSGGETELFDLVALGRFRLLHPLKYNL